MSQSHWEKSVDLINFSVKVAKLQMEKNRHFLFEHPLSASSWKLRSLEDLRQEEGVYSAVMHMCAFGLTTTDSLGVAPALKPTRVFTNA